jgi:enterochelin esterase-like enzyme
VAGAITSVLMSSHAAAISPSRSVNVECRSPSLGGELPAVVYLPAGYAHLSTRYPTIYFLHGLPASPDDYRTNSFVADGVRAAGREAIVVAPQGARAQDSDREYLDWGPRENWPAAIAHDLVPCVDSRFRTIASRVGRALIGLSAGGYGAFNVGLRNLGTFAALESWSGYFAATDPSGLVKLDLGSVSATRSARVPRGRRLRHRLSRRPTFVGFYVGSQDPTFANANVLLDRAFTVHHIPHLFHLYPGGHSTELWERWAPLWLRYALDHLARPRS